MKIEIDNNSLKKYYDKKIIRKFKDIKDKFKYASKIKSNPLIYTVYIKDFGCFETGLTVIEPGTINKELFMTKGHRHQKPAGEIYILIRGKGKLLIKNKKTEIFELKKGKTYIIPGKSGHRLVNTGNEKLEVLTIYPKNAGHDYNLEFEKRIFRK